MSRLGTKSPEHAVTCGLEIHQQLDVGKLFCRCPTVLDEATDVTFGRTLRPTQSELGKVDAAALAEARKGRAFGYEGSDATACLVEADEEPPHQLNEAALDVALTMALMTGTRPVDEVHTMRKLVIDGSNTSGFQRTALVALGGRIDTSKGPVGLQTTALEEDAARIVARGASAATYRLDRLGFPLIEIATEPVLHSGEDAREAALVLGTMLRATGLAKRGLGTIRQDLNISTPRGARVEVKGVQDLDLIPVAVEKERARQETLVAVSDRLRKVARPDGLPKEPVDVTQLFRATGAAVVKKALGAGGAAWALALPGFHGLLGSKETAEHRLGAELAGYARAQGARGLFHTDELPAYGITGEEVAAVHRHLRTHPGKDAFALVSGPADVARRALDNALERARLAFAGVPEETREALEDGNTRYLRPLPGSARMYPETDVPPVRVDGARLARLGAHPPEMPAAKAGRYVKQFGLAADQAQALAHSQDAFLFDELVRESGLAREAARVLLQTRPELERKGLTVEDARVREALAALKRGAFTKEALPEVLSVAARDEVTVAEAARRAGAAVLGEADARAVVEQIIARNQALILSKGEAAVSALMGEAMAALRGKADGQLVSRLVVEAVRAASRR